MSRLKGIPRKLKSKYSAFCLSANFYIIDARVLPFFAGGFYTDLGAVGDEDAVEGSSFPGVIINVRRPRSDHGAANPEGEGRLTVVLVVVPDNDVMCPRGAGVVGPDVAERVRGRAGAVFALEIVGFVIGLSHALGLDPDRAGADRARALA